MQRKAVYLLVLCVLALAVLGLVVLSSTSPYSDDTIDDKLFYTQRQAMWLVIGVVGCVVAALIDYHWWQRLVWVLFAVSLVLLACCFVPEIGKRVNGSARWVDFWLFTFQPSEFAKLSIVAVLAHWFANLQRDHGKFTIGILLPGILAALPMGLILLEVDIGTTLLIGATCGLMMFVGGAGLRYLLPIAAAGMIAVLGVIHMMPERTDRIVAFMDLEAHKLGAGLQQYQGLIAFGSGGVDGLGLGNGRQKMMYLPFAHTDFIFPMIGEELGLKFTLAIIFIYLVIFVCGMSIAVHAKDRFGMLMAFGVVALIGLQAMLNMGVTTALLPNKGLPLPFISYGGSNLVMCLIGVGLLINIYIQGQPTKSTKPPQQLRVRTLHRL